MFLKKSIETQSITVQLCVWNIFHSRKPRSCMEKTAFFTYCQTGNSKMNFDRGIFFKTRKF